MPAHFKWLLVSIIGLICLTTISFAQATNNLVPALNNQLIPLKTLNPDDDYSDLQQLKTILKDKPIVGMGEATHGTHEFFVFKHRMLEFLVKEMGFKTFVIEGDFVGVQALNDYVLYGKGGPEAAIRRVAGPWLTQEFLAMVKWARSYNETRPLADRISFYGCDMQYGNFAVDSLKHYLIQTSQLTSGIEAGFTALNKYLPALTKQERLAIGEAVAALNQVRINNTDTNRVAILRHDVRELQQFLENMNAKSSTEENNIRDKYMAENVEWIYNHTNHNKMMVWAHNEHVGKLAGNASLKRMGMWLSQTFKDQYYVFGFGFNNGKVRTYDMKKQAYDISEVPYAKAGSSDALFALGNAPNFMLDFKSASANPDINRFLHTELPSINIGGESLNGKPPFYIRYQLADAYDGMIFIRETSPSVPIAK